MAVVGWTGSAVQLTGVTATYFTIQRMVVDVPTAQALVTYNMYLDQATHDSNGQPLSQSTCMINFGTLDPSGQITSAVLGLVQAAIAAAQ